MLINSNAMLAYVVVNMMITMNTYKTEQFRGTLHMVCSISCVCILHIALTFLFSSNK